MFIDLSNGNIRSIALRDLPFVKLAQGIEEFVLRRLPERPEPSKVLHLSRKGALLGACFEWSRTAEGWLECAELLDGLTPCSHQYLNYGHFDDAIVEVAFMEDPSGLHPDLVQP